MLKTIWIIGGKLYVFDRPVTRLMAQAHAIRKAA